MELLTQLITSIGFPSFICLLMFYRDMKYTETLTKNVSELSEKLTQLIEKLDNGRYTD